MDCEYHIRGPLAYVKVIMFFLIQKPSHPVVTHYKLVFLILFVGSENISIFVLLCFPLFLSKQVPLGSQTHLSM